MDFPSFKGASQPTEINASNSKYCLEMKARQYELSYIGHDKNLVLNYSVYMKSGLVSPNASISFSVFPSLQ